MNLRHFPKTTGASSTGHPGPGKQGDSGTAVLQFGQKRSFSHNFLGQFLNPRPTQCPTVFKIMGKRKHCLYSCIYPMESVLFPPWDGAGGGMSFCSLSNTTWQTLVVRYSREHWPGRLEKFQGPKAKASYFWKIRPRFKSTPNHHHRGVTLIQVASPVLRRPRKGLEWQYTRMYRIVESLRSHGEVWMWAQSSDIYTHTLFAGIWRQRLGKK